MRFYAALVGLAALVGVSLMCAETFGLALILLGIPFIALFVADIVALAQDSPERMRYWVFRGLRASFRGYLALIVLAIATPLAGYLCGFVFMQSGYSDWIALLAGLLILTAYALLFVWVVEATWRCPDADDELDNSAREAPESSETVEV